MFYFSLLIELHQKLFTTSRCHYRASSLSRHQHISTSKTLAFFIHILFSLPRCVLIKHLRSRYCQSLYIFSKMTNPSVLVHQAIYVHQVLRNLFSSKQKAKKKNVSRDKIETTDDQLDKSV